MTEKKQKESIDNVSAISESRKVLLVLLASLLTFGAPYAVYVQSHLLDLDFAFAIVSGGAAFLVGLFLLWYLIKKRIIA